MNIKYLLLGIILTLFLINAAMGEELGIAIQGNQTDQIIQPQPNETATIGDQGTDELTLEQLMENKDWGKIAELMNKGNIGGIAPTQIESSITPPGSNERWDSWFAPKQEEGGFIVIPCG